MYIADDFGLDSSTPWAPLRGWPSDSIESKLGGSRASDLVHADAPQVAKFIARAIVDDVLPPSFVSLVPARVVESSARVGQVCAF